MISLVHSSLGWCHIMTTENGLFFYQEKSFGKNPALEMRKKPGEIMVKSPLKLFIDLDL